MLPASGLALPPLSVSQKLQQCVLPGQKCSKALLVLAHSVGVSMATAAGSAGSHSS